jgi:hypothetical protein
VGKAEHVSLASEDLPIVVLPQHTLLIPLTEAVRDDRGGIPWLTFTDEGLTLIPEALAALCSKLSAHGRVAYIEANFWGGEGTQASFVLDRGDLLQELLVADDAINVALRLLGTSKQQAHDEFEALGLGACRRTEEWLSRASSGQISSG